MGSYLNPPADAFADIVHSPIYVDKSELISYTNHVMGTPAKLTCSSRPRRFGKSFAAAMLAAYYSRGASAKRLFESLKLAQNPEWDKNLNQYDVLFLDITWFISNAVSIQNTLQDLQQDVIEELQDTFPGSIKSGTISLPKALLQVSAKTGRKFFIIIDEWDALFREAQKDVALQKSYLQFLRGLFKGAQVSQYLAGAYMTGILPIKKYGTQSALTDFKEFTMLEPGCLAEFVGFTEKEVRELCAKYQMDFHEMQRWYDGYRFGRIGHVYSPNSIIESIANRRFHNYWTQTETYESLKLYMDLNFDGLKDAILNLLGGHRCRIDTGTFQNDMTSLESRDDVLTLLVHLGYLAYDMDTKEVLIPNEEVREEFMRGMKTGNRSELITNALCLEHSMVIHNFVIKIGGQIKDSLCRVFGDSVQYQWQENDNKIIIPDVSIICNMRDRKNVSFTGIPRFVMEVLSDSTEEYDRNQKMDIYCKVGVSEYWIADWRKKQVEIYMFDWKEDGTSYPYLYKMITEANKEELQLVMFPNFKIRFDELFDIE